jgi:thiol:disulfide interchange protein DsbD
MKLKNLLLITLIFGFSQSFSQVLKPVKWTFSANKTSDSTANLYLKASMDKGWHIYSQYIKGEGPVPTSFTFYKNRNYLLVGNVYEPKGIEEYDPNFEMTLKFFVNTVTFIQKIKILSTRSFKVKGALNFMTCDNKQCLPPDDVNFSFNMEGYNDASFVKNRDSASSLESKNIPSITITDTAATKVSLEKSDLTGNGSSLWWFFLLSFFAGLAAIITPCVFPMIPMTVTFFMHNENNKAKARFQAFVYGFSIITIYTVLGTIVAVTMGADFANWLSTHWLPNVFFFLIFVIFAISFFGMFEITLPSWMITKTDNYADKSGLLKAFFMAFTLVLVSFSCTGPIVGAILVESAGGMMLKPIIGMFGFALAFALPFTIFAFFPSWLGRLPKSGGWLNSVKVVLAFLELALGLKFLSIADQTYHWGILDRDIYIAFWIVIFTLLGFYLLGKLKFPHDSEVKHISVPRIMLAIITFTFVVYMIPGMFGAPLKALSGYMPPQATHDFDLNSIIRENVENFSVNTDSANAELCDKPKYSDILHLPHGLKGYFDFDQALACAKKLNKPLFIDFTGHGCVNCREMEANVWSDPRALKILREKYIVTALYVDDKKELPESEWITSKYDGKVKKTIGKKYADLQITRYNVNAQPYYVLLDTKGELLVLPKAYDLNADNFVEFLERGLKELKKRSR